MTSVALNPINSASVPQLQPANFLNLLIVDDERAIREACREIAVSLGYSAFVAESAEQAYRALDNQTSTPFYWIYDFLARAVSRPCDALKSAVPKPSSLSSPDTEPFTPPCRQ